MRANQQNAVAPFFLVFSEDQLQEVYVAVLEVLERTGLDLHHPEALRLLSKQGAWVDGIRVRLPSFLVEKALSTAPQRFTVSSWEKIPGKDIRISPNHPHFGPGPTCPKFHDPLSGQRRTYRREDARAVARACDALPNLDFVEGFSTLGDVPADLADVYEFAELIAHTGKPIVAWSYNLAGCRVIHQIAMAVAGGEEEFKRRPNYIFYSEPLSPLTCNEEAMDKVLYCARNRIPLIFTPCPIGGGTAPATGAGQIVQAAAEAWLGLVVSQLIQPGTPFFMGAVVSIMDMRETVLAYGAPELSLLQAGLTELARYVGLPVWSTAGCTDSKAIDEQAALEGALSVLFAALSGADLIHDVGFAEGGITGSLQQAVMMDEVIGMTKRLLKGLNVEEDTLAVEVIDRVGPGGHFLTDQHTLAHFKREFWFPRLMDRKRWEDWRAEGARSLGQRVQEKLNKVLDGREACALPARIQAEIEALISAAERQ